MKKLSVFVVALTAVSLMMTGCKKDVKNQASNVKFKLTDAPAQFDALNIDVKAIQVHSQANGWVTFNSSLGVINILSYVNGSSTIIAEGSIDTGNIDQVRLILGSNNSVVVNGVSHQLQTSGSMQSGLTLNLNNTLQAGGSYEWTIDFDAAQSVMLSGTGSSASFQLDPVIRLIVDPISLQAAGNVTGTGSSTGGGNINISGNGGINISGTTGSVVVTGTATGSITGSLSQAALSSVCITGSNGSSICTMTDLSGHFNIQAVGSGSYSMTITPMLSLFGTHTMSNINVTAGQTTNVGVISM